MSSFQSLDDLDNQLFGKRTGATNRPKVALDSLILSSLEAIKGELQKPSTSSGGRKPTVSFLDEVTGDAPKADKKFNLDDLFSDAPLSKPSTSSGASTAEPSRPSAQSSGGTRNRSYGFGGDRPRRGEPEAEKAAAATPATTPVAAPPVEDASASRAARFEAEIERLNREIVDLRRQKKEDEQTLETEWKERVAKKDAVHAEEMESIKSSYLKQIDTIKHESEEELARMRNAYTRQLEAMQNTLGESRDVSGMVTRVDELTSTLARIAGEVTHVNERSSVERETTLRLREDKLTLREETLERERERLEEEKKIVYELNTKLRDLAKEHEKTLEQEKWKAREEWNRLMAEKEIFKKDQKFILERIDRQRQELEEAKTSFLREQHDLLVRVSNERAALEAEKTDFFSQRTQDVKRIREEAAVLQARSKNVQVADAHVEELKRFYYTKAKQLQELESALMDECVELERLRAAIPPELIEGQHKARSPAHGGNGDSLRLREVLQSMARERSETSESEKGQRDEEYRAVLKQHSELLNKFAEKDKATSSPPYQANSQMYRDL